MIELYYCIDEGILNTKANIFLKENPESQVVNCNNYNDLFTALDQHSLFSQPKAFLIQNASLFSENWKKMGSEKATEISNESKLNYLYDLLSNFKKNKVNVLITVQEAKLLPFVFVKFKDFFDNYEWKLEVLNAKTKINYIEGLLFSHKMAIKNDVLQYLYEIIPPNALIINELINKLILYEKKDINFNELKQILGIAKELDYFQLVDHKLLNNDHLWVEIFNSKCKTVDDAIALFNIYIYKLSEFLEYIILRKAKKSTFEIAKILNKRDFMLRNYEKAYLLGGPNILVKKQKIILKLWKYAINQRKSESLNSNSLKYILINT